MDARVYVFSFVLLFVIVSFVSAIVTSKITKKEFYDKVKLDIEIEQMMKSEKRIKEFFEENSLRQGVAIENIADVLNVKQGGTEQGICSQAYLKNNDKTGEKIVVFKEGLSKEEKNFVFAHEIAHIINGDDIPVSRPVGRNKLPIEQYADYTAAALLMPLERVYDFLTENNYMASSPRKRMILVHQLCRDYGVTEMIVLRRIKEVYTLKDSTV